MDSSKTRSFSNTCIARFDYSLISVTTISIYKPFLDCSDNYSIFRCDSIFKAAFNNAADWEFDLNNGCFNFSSNFCFIWPYSAASLTPLFTAPCFSASSCRNHNYLPDVYFICLETACNFAT